MKPLFMSGVAGAFLLASTLGGLLPTQALADQHPHVHGRANLNLVAEGSLLSLELELPAIDVLGFEHRPRDFAERKSLDQAVERLMNVEQILVINPEADCRIQNAKLDSALLRQDADAREEEHADFEASYGFECSNMADLKGMEVRLFQYFPTLLGLDVQMVMDGRQQGLALTPEANRLDF